MSKSDKHQCTNDLGIFEVNQDLKKMIEDETSEFDPAFYRDEEDITEELQLTRDLYDDDKTEELQLTKELSTNDFEKTEKFEITQVLSNDIEETQELTIDEATEVLQLTRDLEQLMINSNMNLDEEEELELTRQIINIEKTKELTVELVALHEEVQKIKIENNIKDITNKDELKKVEKKALLTLRDLVENASKSVEERQTIELPTIKYKKPLKVSRKEFDRLPTKNGQKVKQVVRKDRVVWSIVFLGSVIGLLYLLFNLAMWEVQKYQTITQIEEINKDVIMEEVLAEGISLDIKKDSATGTAENVIVYQQKKDDYWYYVSQSMLNVDFNLLKKTNSDVKGWIQVNGTNINYPFVQTTNNDYYLYHSIDKSSNSAGWVFLDYRNSGKEFNKNNILYAHGRLDKTMFGSLNNTLSPNWYNNVSNQIIKISTPTSNSLWKVFSVYTIKAESYYIKVDFKNEDDFGNFVNTLKARSIHDFKTEVSKKDKILTLSTCYDYYDTRMVLHAKLIKLEEK